MNYTPQPAEPVGFYGWLLIAAMVLGFSAFTAGFVLLGMRVFSFAC